MSFSFRNGLKMCKYHLRDTNMVFSLLICLFPAYFMPTNLAFLLYILFLIGIFYFVRCFDNPKKLGYEK